MNIELSSDVVIDFGGSVGTQVVDLTNKSREWIEWAIRFGVRQCVKDALAGKSGTPEGEKALREKYQRVAVDGVIPTKGKGTGGGGTSLDDKIASRFLALMGHKGKLNELDERWMSFARVTVLNSIEDKEVKMTVLKDKERLDELAKEYHKAVVDSAMESAEWEKIKEELTKSKAPPPKPTIKIVIGGK